MYSRSPACQPCRAWLVFLCRVWECDSFLAVLWLPLAEATPLAASRGTHFLSFFVFVQSALHHVIKCGSSWRSLAHHIDCLRWNHQKISSSFQRYAPPCLLHTTVSTGRAKCKDNYRGILDTDWLKIRSVMMHGHFQTLMTGPQRLVDIYFWSFGTWTIPTRFLEGFGMGNMWNSGFNGAAISGFNTRHSV